MIPFQTECYSLVTITRNNNLLKYNNKPIDSVLWAFLMHGCKMYQLSIQSPVNQAKLHLYFMVNRCKMTLKLRNNATKAEIVLDVTDKSESCMYYVFDIQLESQVDEGEYTYELYNMNDDLVATGLMQIGDYVAEHTTYENNEKQYIVYNG